VLRRIFECVKPSPPVAGTNQVMFAQEWYADHPGEEMPWNVINWDMGTPVGVWGGHCTCPDGRVYAVGDEGNMCQSVACDGGIQGDCPGGETEGAFRKVICAPLLPVNPDAGNKVFKNDPAVGVWGGTCTCPDGSVYLAGDLNNGCASLACEGGEAGMCNHYVSLWKNTRVQCAGAVGCPSWCENFECDGSAWCLNGETPTPCLLCSSG